MKKLLDKIFKEKAVHQYASRFCPNCKNVYNDWKCNCGYINKEDEPYSHLKCADLVKKYNLEKYFLEK